MATSHPPTIARVDGHDRHSPPPVIDRAPAATLDAVPDSSPDSDGPSLADETGSLITEYFLLAIVAATIASLALKWAAGGAVWELFAAVFDKVRVLLGA